MRTRPRGDAKARQSSTVALPARLSESLSLGHPWVYRTHVPPGTGFRSGSWVHVRAGSFSGYALWDESSPIALRVFSREAPPTRAWFRQRVAEARFLRASRIGADTNAYRLVFGEGDGMPGVSVDIYDRHAVIVTYADSLDAIIPDLVHALQQELSLDGIVRRRGRSGSGERLVLLWGVEPPRPLKVQEHGIRFYVDLEMGQKTGLFLDHRENRSYVREHAGGARVLNLFSYTGGFSVYAASGGARKVTSVDSAAPAMAAAHQNFALNGIDPELHEFSTRDVFEYLEASRAEGRKFDFVISDPPSFAGSKDKQHAALRAYARLHALGLSTVELGGSYAAASCTAQVSPEAFRQVLAESAARARVRLQLVHDIGHAADHPVFAGHAEGRYLKFMVGRVLARV